MSDFKQIPIYRGFTEIEALFNLVHENGGHILGGYVRYMASPKWSPIPGEDVDVFSSSEESFDKIKGALGKELTVAHESPIAISYQQKTQGLFAYCPKVQLIKPRKSDRILTVGSMEEILSIFDFSVVRIGLFSKDTALADVDFLEHETRKRLVVKNITCSVSNFSRAMKYSKKGYFMPIESVMKLLNDWINVSDEYRNTVTDLIALRDLGDATEQEIEQLEELMLVD